MRLMDLKEIEINRCLTLDEKCGHLRRAFGYSPETGRDVVVYVCLSEEDSCASCERSMKPLEMRE